MSKIHNPQAGLTMIEMIMILAISGIIIAFAIINFGDVLSTSDAQTASQNILNIRVGIAEAYNVETNYSALSNTQAIALHAIPSSVIKGSNLRNVFGGAITLAPNSNDEFFDITYDTVPEKACPKLALLSRGEWEAVSVNGTDIPQSGSGGTTAVAQACSSDNTIIYTAN